MRKLFITNIISTTMLSSICFGQIDVSVSTDRDIYMVGEDVEITVTAYNPATEPITLNMSYPGICNKMNGVVSHVKV